AQAYGQPQQQPQWGQQQQQQPQWGQPQQQQQSQYGQPNVNAQAIEPPSVQGIPLYNGWESPESKRFVVDGYKDVWAAVLFIATLFTMFVWGIVNYSSDLQDFNSQINGTNVSKLIPSDETTNSVSGGALVGVIFLITAIGTICAIASLFLLCKFSRQAIYVANVGVAVLNIIAAIIAFATGFIVAGILLIICGGLQLLWLYLVRARIPFSAELLRISSGLVLKYKTIILTNFLLIGFLLAYVIFWAAAVYPYLNRGIEAETPAASDAVLTTLLVLFFFWTSQVVFNVMHVTASGLAATWYFVGSGAMPHNPTLASLRRAVTTSFGSICFGSLLVALIKTVRYIVESQRNHDHPFVACIVDCILGCLERLVEYFNTYAFVHVAIYGCGYVEAASRTWKLAKECFFAAYFNDALVGTTILFVSLGISAFIGVITAVAADNGAIGGLVFCLAFGIHTLVFNALESFVVTIFVCFAQHPQALQASSPELYAMLVQADSGRQQV
ncbi:choline transporter, putative, partial [Bodo saltans]